MTERHHFEPEINNQCHECKAEEYVNQPWKSQHFPGLVRGDYSTDCPTCSGSAEGTATYATGDVEMGGGYMPYDGELMKIVYVRCEACGWDQAS
jgi:hypothetical protein|tara:strand:+ start:335 stop:616 length:282 start_codon:yes stop_codon:yes gene_type:complete